MVVKAATTTTATRDATTTTKEKKPIGNSEHATGVTHQVREEEEDRQEEETDRELARLARPKELASVFSSDFKHESGQLKVESS